MNIRIVVFCLFWFYSFSLSADQVSIDLLMDVDSNWPTEHCVDVKKGVLNYTFQAPHPTKFGTHIHNKDGVIHQVRNKILSQFNSDVVIDSSGEDFCFTWQRTKNYKTDWMISLQYELLVVPGVP